MFCKKCGSELTTNDKTCPKCGTSVNDKFATEEYDPLLALDKENIEDNVIWQEAPPEVDTIIINTAKKDKEFETGVGEPMFDGQPDKNEKDEKNLKDNVAQGLRAAKATISNPIKPRRRVKPQTTAPKSDNTLEEVIIPETSSTQQEVTDNLDEFDEPIVESIFEEKEEAVETPVETPVQETVTETLTEAVAPTVTETVVEEPVQQVVEEVPVAEEIVMTQTTDSTIEDEEVVDLFDDFVVDDSFGIIDESPDIIEEEPAIIEEEPEIIEETVETPVSQEVPVTETVETPTVAEKTIETVTEAPAEEVITEDVVVEAPVEEVTPTQEVVTEAPMEDVIIEPFVDNEITPEEALFDEPLVEDMVDNTVEPATPRPEPSIERLIEETPESVLIEEVPAEEETVEVEGDVTSIEEVAEFEEVENIAEFEESVVSAGGIEAPETGYHQETIPKVNKEVVETVQTTQEQSQKSTIEKIVPTSGVSMAGSAVAGAAERAKNNFSTDSDNVSNLLHEKSVIRKDEDSILNSMDDTKYESDFTSRDVDRDQDIKSKFNTTLDDEDEILDVDENINSLTSKITTVLIIVLILIIAVVVATFIMQHIGL